MSLKNQRRIAVPDMLPRESDLVVAGGPGSGPRRGGSTRQPPTFNKTRANEKGGWLNQAIREHNKSVRGGSTRNGEPGSGRRPGNMGSMYGPSKKA